jgi:hypothetical protein
MANIYVSTLNKGKLNFSDGNITNDDNNTVIGGGTRIAFVNSTLGTINATDTNIYLVNTDSSTLSIRLPDSVSTFINPGYTFTVIDETGKAGTNNIVITKATTGTDNIISAPTGVTIDTNYGMICFEYLGSKKWAILYGR